MWWFLWMEVIKKRNGSLVPHRHLFALLFSSRGWKRGRGMGVGGSQTSGQPTTVLDNRRSHSFFNPSVGSHFFPLSPACTDPQLMGTTTSWCLMANVPNGEACWSRPETFGFGPVNIQIYILPCGPFYSLFHCLSTALSLARSVSLSSTTPPFLALSRSLSLFSSQDPSHCWMAALPVSALTWLVSQSERPRLLVSPCHYSP